MFKVSSFYIDTPSLSSLKRWRTRKRRNYRMYGLSVVKHRVSSDFRAILYIPERFFMPVCVKEDIIKHTKNTLR